MNKTSLVLVWLLLSSLTHLFGQKYYMDKPEGYGAATTGGGNATPVTVSTYNALKSALTASGPGVILVSGTIDFTSAGMMKIVVKDKTLLGLPGATFTNTNQSVSGILYLNTGSSNVIIRNLKFVGPGAWDNNGNDNLTVKPATNLWVDHCEFQDGEDGNFDNSGATDNVTVSWCKFTYLKATRAAGSGTANDHRFSDLIGGDKSDAPSDGHYSITWQNCWWSNGCKERMPRARNAELHMLNCYWNTDISGSLAIGIGGGDNNSTCYVENSNFAKVSTVFKDYSSSDGGSVKVTFSNCLNAVSNIGSAVPKPSYSTSSFPASNVETAVTDPNCGAGATLQVTSQGVISSKCITTGLASPDMATSSATIYPNPSFGTFIVKGRENIKSISIVDSAGDVVYFQNNIQGGNEMQIAANLVQALYFVKLEYVSGVTEMVKLVGTR
ncbi:MAG: T9SS type A sorting domain-containing protein [Bacteroidota bacterium]|nr:T9SS type A sorting domain-containing protein [Bacteroidota bacterium]